MSIVDSPWVIRQKNKNKNKKKEVTSKILRLEYFLFVPYFGTLPYPEHILFYSL